jgi:hypothetical protein
MKIRGKRGQGASEGGYTVIGLVLGLVILGLLIWLIFLGGYKTVGNIFNTSGTNSLDSVIQGCQLAQKNSFCSDLKYTQLGENNTYVTCSYLASIGRLDSSSYTCDATNIGDLRANCRNLKKTGITVNGEEIKAITDCDKLTK